MQIEVVRSTWKSVLPFRDDVAHLLYKRLFEIEPELSVLFRGDMQDGVKKIILMLDLAITNLEQLEQVMPALQELSNRYVQSGMKMNSNVVRNTLISTFEQYLGDAFTMNLRNDLIQSYDLLHGVMKDAVTEKVTYGFTD